MTDEKGLLALAERVEGLTGPDSKSCEHCGANFGRKPHHTDKKWEKQRFCSQRCAGRKVNTRLVKSVDDMRSDLQRRSMTDEETGCWIYQGFVDTSGYTPITWGGRKIKAHRLSYELFCAPIPAGMCVCHTCDNRRCVRPDHLFLGTNADNMADRNAKGRQSKGERQGRAKLSDSIVAEIMRSTEPVANLAKKFGVGETTVGNVKRGTSWTHVTSALRAMENDNDR